MHFNDFVCLFCHGPHDTVDCPAYPTIGIRMKLLNAQKTCYRCLIPGHIPPMCKNVVPCNGCSRLSHHKALCWRNDAIKDSTTKIEAEKCVFCNRHNDSNRCRPVNSHSARFALIQATNRCIKCLKMHHGQPCDTPDVSCEFCNKSDHHKALCIKNFRIKENESLDPAYSSCLLCAQHKNSTQCVQVKLLSQRRQILTNQKRCLKCLRIHPSVQCHQCCRICRSEEHHAVLCPHDPRVIVDEDTSTMETTPNQETLSPSTSSSSQNSTSDSSEVSSTDNRTPEISRPSETFFDFIMNLQLPEPYVQWAI